MTKKHWTWNVVVERLQLYFLYKILYIILFSVVEIKCYVFHKTQTVQQIESGVWNQQEEKKKYEKKKVFE